MNIEEITETSIGLMTQWGFKILGAVALLIVGRMVAGLIRKAIRRAMKKADADPTLIPFVSSLAYYLAVAVVIIAVLGIFGIQTTSLVAILGAAGLAVGLALQGTLSHFASGVMLLIFRPFGVGDLVEVADTTGKVEKIGIFTTTLKSVDNVMITVPNSQVYGNTIKNMNGYDTRRVDMVMGVSYGDDLGLAMDDDAPSHPRGREGARGSRAADRGGRARRLVGQLRGAPLVQDGGLLGCEVQTHPPAQGGARSCWLLDSLSTAGRAPLSGVRVG